MAQSNAGRPTIEFTEEMWNQATKAAEIGCSGEEIAALLGVSYDTLSRRIKEKYDSNFAEWFNARSHKFKMSFRRSLVQIMMNPDKIMKAQSLAIFCAKNWLGMTDKVETMHSFNKDEKLQIDLSGKGFINDLQGTSETDSISQESSED